MSGESDTVTDRLIAVRKRLRPYHTISVVLLILTVLVDFVIELPTFVWVVFLCYFGVNLAGIMARQRRDSPYA